MRVIDGYIFIGQLPSEPADSFMFGPNKRGRKQKWWNFTMNGLKPFRTRLSAETAGKQCRGVGHLTNFYVCHLRMLVGETPEEWQELLQGEGSWVVISNVDGRQEIRGKYREGCLPKAIPGGDMQMNGMLPLDNPDSVLYIRSECQRQFGVRAVVSTFLLQEVEQLP